MGRMYTPAEVSEILRVSVDTVYQIFRQEKGVILLESASRLSMSNRQAKHLGRYQTIPRQISSAVGVERVGLPLLIVTMTKVTHKFSISALHIGEM